ncbi:MAG TPA: hypothetical protein VLT59_17945, partial [Steroidobacteraceae bacterium]|nr:hypothetical protein [Steroidobacteraceae bacterium]
RNGNPATLIVPDAPGTYEVRYVQSQSRSVLARQAITVTAVSATLEAPDQAPSGSEIAVRWTGPANENDYIAIADPDAPGGKQHRHAYPRNGNPATLIVPDAPGTYEVRYVQSQSRSVLARRPLTVVTP